MKSEKETPVCSDACFYCSYIGEGDFFCAAANIPEVTIVDWTPKTCVCPKKRRFER